MKTSASFTFLELMVVIFLIGIVMAVGLPMLVKKGPSWKTILNDMNNLVFFARQEAIAKQTTYRIEFGQNEIVVKEGIEDPTTGKITGWNVPKNVYYIDPTYKLDPAFEIEAPKDCYVIHDGLVQETEIAIKRIDGGGSDRKIFTMSPFDGKFEMK